MADNMVHMANIEMLKQWYHEIIKHLKVAEVIPYLISNDVIPLEFGRQLRKQSRTNSNQSAAENLLEYILKDHAGKHASSLLAAMAEADLDYLIKLIKGKVFKNPGQKDIFQKLLETQFQDIKDINSLEIATELYAINYLSQTAYEEVRADVNNHGTEFGVYTLMSHLIFYKEDWFTKFICVLKKLNYVELIKKIHPDIAAAESDHSISHVIWKIAEVNIDPSYQSDPAKEAALHQELDHPTPSKVQRLSYSSLSAEKPLMDCNPAVTVQNRPAPEGMEVNTDSTFIKRPVEPEQPSISHESNNLSLPPELGDSNRSRTGVSHLVNDMNNIASQTTPKTFMDKNISLDISEDLNATNLGSQKPMSCVRPYSSSLSCPSGESNRDESGIEDETAGDDLQLRSYQLELAQKALEGKNVIVSAPTGSGKTHVALYISKEHLEMAACPGDHKIVFIVPTVALVEQQRNHYLNLLRSYRCIGISGDIQSAAKVPFQDIIPQYDILVITPQILVDALQSGGMKSLSYFTLMIFDECHHTTKDHPYNNIMAHYMECKLSTKSGQSHNLPQIVGLTASTGVGKARNDAGAVEHILKLCANMDAEALCTVVANKQELKQHVNLPDEYQEEVKGRSNDPFQREIGRLMMNIENKMKNAPEVQMVEEIKDMETLLVPPSDRGSQRYSQWITKVRREIACIYEQQHRRMFMTCINHLQTYNDALMINADCRTKDGLEHIQRRFSDLKPQYFDETDRWLETMFKDQEDYLTRVSTDPKFNNPKLTKIQRIILGYAKKRADLRGIIFTKTREMTLALQNWMLETPELKPLNPKRLTGSNAAADRAGTTQVQQQDALKFFKEGTHKILIATTVAEEGLDIQKCNLVIRYEHVTNEIAMVQARGRGRAQDAQYVLVAETGRGTTEKEQFNKIREDMMNRAIQNIQQMDPQEFARRVKDYQLKAQLERRMAEHDKRARAQRNRRTDAYYELRCIKCDALGCLSLDIRKMEEMHHMVIEKGFRNRIVLEPHPKPTRIGKTCDLTMTSKIFCGRCHQEWGIMAQYRKMQFPVLKLVGFVLVDQDQRRTIAKKWKESPFAVAEFTTADMNKFEEMRDDDDDDLLY